MSKARNIADLLDANGDVVSGSLDNVPPADLVNDTTPQLGGTLDANGNTIDMGTNVITDTKVGQWDTAYGWGDHSAGGYAPLASPALTGTPTAPTAAGGTNTTQIATTAYVQGELSGIASDAITEGNSSVEVVDTGADGRVVLTTEGAERARVDASGNLMVGTTSTNNAKFRFSGGDMKLDSFTRYAFGGDPDYAYMESVNEGSQNVGLAFGTTTVAGEGIERVRITHDGDLRFNSGYGSVATAYGCRAWANFNGNSLAIRQSGNVSSVVRAATGNYQVNLSTALPDANYTAAAMAASNTASGSYYEGHAWVRNSSSVRVHAQWTGTLYNVDYVGFMLVR